VVSSPMRSLQGLMALGDFVDGCYTAAWRWRFQLWLAERRYDRALVKFGEDSMEARRVHVHWTRLDFAVQFGRPAPGPVREVVNSALQLGVSADDLRLMVLSRDIDLVDGGAVSVRQGSWMAYLQGSPVGAVCLTALWVCLSLIAYWQLSLGQKAVCLVATGIWYWLVWRGWSLLYFRAPRALLRTGDLVASLAKMQESAVLLAFPSTELRSLD
jgi:hypothetical protein